MEETQPQQPTENSSMQKTAESNNSDEDKNVSIVDEAKKLRDEIRAENERREQILKDEQKLQAEKMLGSSAGGRVEKQQPKEETAEEYTKKVMGGNI